MLVQDDIIIDKSINVLIRYLDSKKCKWKMIQNILPKTQMQIDQEVRNCFTGGAEVGIIKCLYEYNRYEKLNA